MIRLVSRSLFAAAALALAVTACSDDDDATPAAPTTATTTSTSEAALVASHIDVMKRRIVANNAKDWNTWEALHKPEAVRTAPELPGPLATAKAMRAGIEELLVTFPDYHLELVDAFGSGDRLVARIHTRATMLGPMPIGETMVPATGKVFEQDWIAVVRFDGDKIASIDEFHDNYGILVQLGLSGS